MLESVKRRIGIAPSVTIYDEDINMYIEECKQDMLASGVPESVLYYECESTLTAITLYVRAYLGNDRSETNSYLSLYRSKVFRMTLEEEEW